MIIISVKSQTGEEEEKRIEEEMKQERREKLNRGIEDKNYIYMVIP